MHRILKLTALVAFSGFVFHGTAFAHATLEQAVPAVGSTVAVAPKEIRLKYSEGVEAKLCKVTVTGGKGAVQSGSAHTESGDKATLIVSLPGSLGAGTYKVKWRVVSVDTHRSEGSFSFTIQP
jgi:methionine-rich copper-binding protein CopC